MIRKECPRCRRLYKGKDYLYCEKCGERLAEAENRCSAQNRDLCSRILAKDAEYCPYCGAPTIYHLDKQVELDGGW